MHYTPQPDGSLAGVMHTEIASGACKGTIDMNMTAVRV
ncbi:putative secreted protein [Mycobacterium tuberculosis]|nr:putative secreted protein [Mycobacterium tuberculosis]